jgi:hypothetical protein
MSEQILIKDLEIDGFQVQVFVVDTQTSDTCSLDEMFSMTDEHKGGITIKVPDFYGSEHYYHYGIPKQTSLAELSAQFAAQGRENPSQAAYGSLQHELGWYCTAVDCYLLFRAYKAGVLLAEETGISFDYSHEFAEQDLLVYSQSIYDDYQCEQEVVVQNAKDKLGELCSDC